MNLNKSAYSNDSVVFYMDEKEDINGGITTSSAQSLALQVRSPGKRRKSSLLETDNNYNPKPNYGPEVDDMEPGGKDDDDERSVDNGLLPSPFPSGTPSGLIPHVPFDVNVYQQKKTLAQGMMDLALISANANQLRYVLSAKSHPFYYASLSMISMSLILQIVVGIGLIWNSRYDVKEDADVHQANRANNWTVIGIFLVTILNVFISSFGITDITDVITIPYLSLNTTDDETGLETFQRLSNMTLNDTIV